MLKDILQNIRNSFQRLPKERKILGAFLILAISFILYQSMIALHILRLRAVDLQLSAQKKLVSFYSRLVRDSDTLINELKEKERSILRIKEEFVEEHELANYFGNFRTLVKSYNLQLLSLDFKPQEAVAGQEGVSPLKHYKKIPFTVSVKGDYFDTMSLLYKLEQNKPIFDIKSIQLKREDPRSYAIAMSLEAAIYILTGKN